jgi:hypothetical protein
MPSQLSRVPPTALEMRIAIIHQGDMINDYASLLS